MTNCEKNNYPCAIFFIIAIEFCERFSFCGLRTILSLYLRNVLLFHENSATFIYHMFITVCYVAPLAGAVLADGVLGRFRTIFYFCCVYAAGNLLLCSAASPPVNISPVPMTIFGLTLIGIGTGGIKPCVAAFGGDQFHLPRQEDLLKQFFSVFYFAICFGGLLGMFVIPALRRTVTCFNEDSCYALGFGFSAGLMFLALFFFLGGKPLYRIKEPREDVMAEFIKCASFAIWRKICSKKDPKKHWLDYASGHYRSKLISDMKTVFAILSMYLPLPFFWALFDQQGSRWTFQASRMDSNFLGMWLMPDQIQVVNPAMVLILIPLFDKGLYPLLRRHRQLMSSPLHKMMLGGITAGLSFVAAGLLEIKLEETYPVLPRYGEAQLNIINTLPCDVDVVNPFNKLQSVSSAENYVFRAVSAKNYTSNEIFVFVPKNCDNLKLRVSGARLNVLTSELQVISVIISSTNDKLELSTAEPDELEKSLSGKPKLRVMLLQSSPSNKNITVNLHGGVSSSHNFHVPNKKLSSSIYWELDPGRYNYSLSFSKTILNTYQGEMNTELGAVYSLVIQEIDYSVEFSKLYEMTPPNTIHMVWLLPQYVLISVSEVMFVIAGLQFSFTQAPKSMRTVTLAAWYLSVAVGNLLVVIVTQAGLCSSQTYEFFLFATLTFIGMIIFCFLVVGYKFVRIEPDGSSALFLGAGTSESLPLLHVSESTSTE